MSSTNSTDLLVITKVLDDINGEIIGTDTDYGMHYNLLAIGMSGQEMVDKLNSNFSATDAQFKSFNDDIAIRIISSNIKEIKVENGIVMYTTDNQSWVSLQSTWGNILGDITKQEDLYQILGDKVNTSTFTELQTIVNKNKSDITDLIVNVNSLTSDLSNISTIISGSNGILIRLTNVETDLNTKVSSNQVKAIRSNDGISLEFTLDNEIWKPVSDVGIVEWGNITGDISNQADLIAKFNDINNSLSDYASDIQTINDNISKLESQYEGLNELLSKASTVNSISEYEYLQLLNSEPSQINENTIYIVSPGGYPVE